MNRYYSILALLPFVIASLFAQGPDLVTRDVITNLDTPWEVLWGPDDMIWFTERPGRVSRMDPETGQRKVILTLTDVYEQSESGLLGMVHHPSFPDSPYVFLVYNYREATAIKERVVRYTWGSDTLTNRMLLIEDLAGSGNHNGSRLVIGADGKLLVTTGDATVQSQAQDHTSLNGKILRMNLDGSIPPDNPWANAPGRSGYLYTTGHRNPQGLHLASNGILYSSEHGPNNDDEINIITPGRNYGWPTVQGFCDQPAEQTFCNDSNVVEPIFAWTPTIATAGLEYYDNPAIPEWRNSLLLVTLKEQDLRQLKLSSDGRQIVSETIFFNNRWGRLRDLCVSPDGRVFIGVSERDGRGSPVTGDDRIVEIRSATPPGATIVIDSLSTLTITAGDSIFAYYTVTGNFDAGNVFALQLSNSVGGFTIPTPIGVIGETGSGRIGGKIPCDANGSGYRLRITSTGPAIISADNGADVTVRPLAPVIITPSGPLAFCKGDSITLDAGAGFNRYVWAHGDTTRIITVRDGGGYGVTVTHPNGCRSTSSTVQVRVIDPKPGIDRVGDTLRSTGGYAGYRWFRDGVLIDGATGRTYLPTQSGRYSVEGTTPEGCVGLSDEIDFIAAGVDREPRGVAVRLSPVPTHDRLSIELDIDHPSSMRIEIIDARGALLHSYTDRTDGGTWHNEFSTTDLPSGAYLLRIFLDHGTVVRRFVAGGSR